LGGCGPRGRGVLQRDTDTTRERVHDPLVHRIPSLDDAGIAMVSPRDGSSAAMAAAAQARASPATSWALPDADHPDTEWPALSPPGSRVRSVHACWGSQTAQSPRSTRGGVLLDVTFHAPPASALWTNSFRGAIPRLPVPLPTSRLSLHGDLRTARGRGGALDLPRNGHAPYAPYRSPGKSGRSVTRSVVPTALSCQCFEQRLGLLEGCGVKALGEPCIDRRQERTVERFPSVAPRARVCALRTGPHPPVWASLRLTVRQPLQRGCLARPIPCVPYS
jgi:hypothetical protein